MSIKINQWAIVTGNYKTNTNHETHTIRWKYYNLHACTHVLKRFINLRVLVCSRCQLMTLRGLDECPNLTELDCSINRLTSLVGLEYCPQLVKLNCSSNQLTSIAQIAFCPGLRVLNCSINRLRTYRWAEVGLCTQLRELRCGSNNLATLTKIKGCPQLETLDYSHNRLRNLDGLQFFPNLLELDFSGNKLSACSGLTNCPLLRKLMCSKTKIESLTEISQLMQLVELDCSSNPISSLEELQNCRALEVLNCSGTAIWKLDELNGLALKVLDCSYTGCNMLVGFKCESLVELICESIQTLDGIEGCPRLKKLECCHSFLKSLGQIGSCTKLEYLDCSFSRLVGVTELATCTKLRVLKCTGNKLVSLNGIEGCHRLEVLDCFNNKIESLEPIINLRSLRKFSIGCNPLATQSIQVQQRMALIKGPSYSKPIYSNTENVLDASIQKTVGESVKRLLHDPKPTFSTQTIRDSSLDASTIQILLGYCADSVRHPVHLLTYAELLAYVWARIDSSEHKAELLRILSEQVCDSKSMCFTGRFNRLVSVLVGFYPDITIEISDNSRIKAIILAVKARVEPYDWRLHQDLAREALLEAGYFEAEVKPWLRAISEP